MPLVLDGTNGVSGVDGTASNPAIEGTDSNTGIFYPAADTVAIGTGGTERLRVDSAGNAGLGVTPSAWNASYKAFQIANTSSIMGGTSGNDTYYLTNAYFDSAWKYAVSSKQATRYEQVLGVHAWYNAPSGTAGNAITFTQAMTLDASGRLGIGLTGPAYPLDVYRGSSGVVLNLEGVNAYNAETGITLSSGRAKISGFLNGSGGTPGSTLRFYTMPDGGSVTEAARITSGGSLIVGGTSVSFTGAMSEFQQSSGSCYVSINRTGTLANGDQAAIYAVGGSRQASTFVYKHSGITNPCGALNVQCEDAEQNYLWADNSDVLRISTNAANIGTTGGTVVGTQTSDERLKNISGAISYGLTEVMALQPIAFAMKDDPETAKIGFSAQQVQPIIPESVYDTGECIDGYDVDPEDKLITTPKSDRTKLAMEYTQLIPVLTKAIQELNAKVEAQAAEIAALKGNA